MTYENLWKDDPIASDLHVDGLLTSVSIGYSNAAYIGDELCPDVMVRKQSDIYAKYDQSPWFRDEAELRARGSRSAGSGWTVDNTNKYFTDRFSYRHEVHDEDRSNVDAPYQLDREAAEFVADKIAMRKEVAKAAAFFATGIWDTDKTGGTDFTKFSDYAGSTPLKTFTDYMDTVEGNIAREPNRLTMGKQVWRVLRWHPDLVDSMKATDVKKPTADLLAQLIDIEKVLIGRGIYTTTDKGVAEGSVSYTRIWGNDALLHYVPNTPSLRKPSGCLNFVWARVPNASMYIKRMRDEEREVDIIEGNTYFDPVVTSSNAGLFMSTAT